MSNRYRAAASGEDGKAEEGSWFEKGCEQKKKNYQDFHPWILLFQLNLPDPPTVVVEMRKPQEFEDDSISLVNVGSVEKPSIEELLTM